MEQQSQARERQREQPQDRRAEENRRTPERERLSDAGLAAQAGPAEETSFRMPEGEPETEPFPVPESPGLLLDAPQGLTAQESPGPAFDPANLQG